LSIIATYLVVTIVISQVTEVGQQTNHNFIQLQEGWQDGV
jgi:hypothetical protein